jgi:hypothetical protein
LDVFEDFFFAIAMDHQKITGRRLFFFFFVEYQRLTMENKVGYFTAIPSFLWGLTKYCLKRVRGMTGISQIATEHEMLNVGCLAIFCKHPKGDTLQ